MEESGMEISPCKFTTAMMGAVNFGTDVTRNQCLASSSGRTMTTNFFDGFQWRLLVPTFALNEDKTIQHRDLEEKEILPWCEEKLQSHSEAMSGGYGSVKKVKIHPLCHEFHEHLKAVCLLQYLAKN